MRILRQRKDLFVQKTGKYYRQPNGLTLLRALVENLKRQTNHQASPHFAPVRCIRYVSVQRQQSLLNECFSFAEPRPWGFACALEAPLHSSYLQRKASHKTLFHKDLRHCRPYRQAGLSAVFCRPNPPPRKIPLCLPLQFLIFLYEIGFTHSSSAIDSHKLRIFRPIQPFQFINLLLSSNDICHTIPFLFLFKGIKNIIPREITRFISLKIIKSPLV